MRYYTVWVRSLGYRGREPLTYAAEVKLRPGQLVLVPLQREKLLGFVEAEVTKPHFATKPVSRVFHLSPLPAQHLALANWLRDFYASNIGIVSSLFLPPGFTEKALQQPADIVVNNIQKPLLSPLTAEQASVVKKITKADTYLLHGATGSGKTRVYIELAQRVMAAHKSALILTPEISLTSQLAHSFEQVFDQRVLVLHSQLTPAQRQRLWLQILRADTPLVVIGPRSALFSPLRNLGLIVIDEAHEPAYKQEQAPYYHARAVASQLAHLHNAYLIIGSATPAVTDYYLAEARQKPILRMTQLARPNEHPPTTIEIIDLRERSLFNRSQQLSQPLVEAIETALARQEQALIFLNRRGTARTVICEHCGWQALCPNCDLPLIYHADSASFRCHTCGHHEPMRTSCPACGHPSILFKTFGTKAVTEEVHKLFPHAKVQRFDTDNTKAERFEQQYDAIKRGTVDILVGTQLLAKGLDLPKLSVIGLLQADSSLSIPDFSATERTYQLISQALGRVGRGHTAGQAIIQTFHPEGPVIQAAIQDDYANFYNTEISERRQFHFPPFYYLLKLSCRRASYASAEKAADKLKNVLETHLPVVEIAGPTPSFYEKLQGKYQVQLVVRSKQRPHLLEAIKLLPSGWTYDIDPINLL